MSLGFRSRAVLGVALAGLLASGCTQIRDQDGYIVDDTLVNAIQAGVDNRESVAGTLGRPTFTSQFGESDWYYVSRATSQRAFGLPRPVDQTVLHIRFDESGTVERVERTGLELVANINPANDKTPTLGQDRGFLRELFGNIGAVGQAAPGTGTADNPQ